MLPREVTTLTLTKTGANNHSSFTYKRSISDKRQMTISSSQGSPSCRIPKLPQATGEVSLFGKSVRITPLYVLNSLLSLSSSFAPLNSKFSFLCSLCQQQDATEEYRVTFALLSEIFNQGRFGSLEVLGNGTGAAIGAQHRRPRYEMPTDLPALLK